MSVLHPEYPCRYADKTNMELGLLFTCRLGNVDLDRPVGLLQKKDEVGTQTTMEATLMAQQSPGQREQVKELLMTSSHSYPSPSFNNKQRLSSASLWRLWI